MSGERQLIRDSLKSIIETVFVGNVIASRVFDSRGKENFISIYFDSGDDDWEGLQPRTTATVFVSYLVKNFLSDDEIDQVADSIHDALGSAVIAPEIVKGFLPAGFAYISESESAYSGITLRYTVIY